MKTLVAACRERQVPSRRMTDFEVRRDDLRTSQIVARESSAQGEGEAHLRVGRFGLTANNVT